MHRDEGVTVQQIAADFGVKLPAIYRAFRQRNYRTEKMKRADEGANFNYPPAANDRQGQRKFDMEAEEAAIAAMRIVPRDPCPRCGVRGDIGCRCPKTPLGWRAG